MKNTTTAQEMAALSLSASKEKERLIKDQKAKRIEDAKINERLFSDIMKAIKESASDGRFDTTISARPNANDGFDGWYSAEKTLQEVENLGFSVKDLAHPVSTSALMAVQISWKPVV